MNFDDSLFEDISSNRKEKRKQYPYSVRRQEFCWFLSDTVNPDQTRMIEQLKFKADYFYAQSSFTQAIKCFEDLLPLIPPSNSVLTQEVCESKILCWTKLGETEKAEKCLEDMIKNDRMNETLWYLKFLLERDKNNIDEAIFAIKQCIEENEENALYWIDLADTYVKFSTCYDQSYEIDSQKCGQENIECNSTDLSLKAKEEASCMQSQTLSTVSTCDQVQGVRLLDSDLLKLKFSGNEVRTNSNGNMKNTNTCFGGKEVDEELLLNNEHTDSKKTENLKSVRNLSVEENNLETKLTRTTRKKDMSNTKTFKCSVTEKLCATYIEQNVFMMSEELKDYVKNHYYCYCTLASLIMARYILHKYPACSKFTKQERKTEKIHKVKLLITHLTCVTDIIENEIRNVWL